MNPRRRATPHMQEHSQTMKTENLGTANRNPLNIRYQVANRWLGLDPVTPNVRGFCKFISFAHGYRAAIVLMKTYIQRYGCDTPETIIARWAPPCENRTDIYIACVCGRSRLKRDEHIAVTGMQIPRLVAAMARQETGAQITPEGIQEIRERFGV